MLDPLIGLLRSLMPRRPHPAAVAFGFLLLAGCSTNPVTGNQSFTAFMSPAEEVRIGAEQHPKILDEFGGAYEEDEIGAYVAVLGARLAAVSDRPDLKFTFTVLDSPLVNAFALPGGYVYLSRGLMALANNEAELAGVVGHEIGHVTARHSAERYSRGVVANLGAGLLGAVIGDRAVADALNLGSNLYLRAHSRDSEFEADTLGLRYMTRAGYDPDAVATFLESLRARDALDARLAGSDRDPDGFNLLATHPRTVDRVREAQRATGATGPGALERERYLKRIDGMLYGDDPEQGFVRDRTFQHPVLRFEFTVPPGFILFNGSRRVVARNANGAIVSFDGAPVPRGVAMDAYLANSRWTRDLRLTSLETLSINGLEAATASSRLQSQSGSVDLRLVAIRTAPDRIYRFVFTGPSAEIQRLETELRRTTYSFRLLSEAEAAELKPHRLRLHAVQPGDTAETLAELMPSSPEKVERFRVLNGFTRGEQPRVGTLVKYVAE